MQRQLILALLIGILLVAGAVGSGLYYFVQRQLNFQFNSALDARARALAACVHLTREGVEMSAPDDILAEYSRSRRPQYFQIWNADGTVFLRSKSLGPGANLPTQAGFDRPVFRDVPLPDERDGRAAFLHFTPHPADADDVTDARLASGAPRMTIAVAQNRRAVDEPLEDVLVSLISAAVLLAGGVVVVVAITVRRGLRPLAEVADGASRINADSLEFRFPVARMPVELAPICQRLNDLLERLDGAFKRERRFTSDVAHELRTPIAELRSLSEVAIRWPTDAVAAQANFQDALQISRHMERMVTTLLALARCESGRQALAVTNIDLNQIVNDAWRPLEPADGKRKLRIKFALLPDAVVRGDASLLASIVSNLLSNATQYATENSEIDVSTIHGAGGVVLNITNQTEGLSAADLPHLFEPFWRKDAARSPDEHSGLGLALVKAYADVLHAKLEATMPQEKTFCITLELPAVGSATLVTTTPSVTGWNAAQSPVNIAPTE
jgi:two-component system sensor histidine kinase QseC